MLIILKNPEIKNEKQMKINLNLLHWQRNHTGELFQMTLKHI